MQTIKISPCVASVLTWGGVAPAGSAAEPAAAEADLPLPPYLSLTLGVEIGATTVVGGLFSWHFADHWGVRSGFDYLRPSDTKVSIRDIEYPGAKLQLMSEPLPLDIYPWVQRSFHINVGAQVNQNRLTGSASDTRTIIIDGQPFRGDRVGTLKVKIKQQPVNPYLNIVGNLFYFDHAPRWAMGGELGVAYTFDQSVALTRPGPFAPLIDAASGNEES